MSKSSDIADGAMYVNDAINSLEKALRLFDRTEYKAELQKIYDLLDDFSSKFD
jgi:hypothetical protein